MFMKKNVLVSLSVATLLSVGAVGVNEINGVANNTNVVQAAVKNGKLTHNAYIYKSNGNRYGKKVLKKGKTVKILGTKKIYGKKYTALVRINTLRLLILLRRPVKLIRLAVNII